MAKRFIQRFLALILVLAMLISTSSYAFAEAAPGYSKQEVVYVNLASDGEIKDIYVVNIFDLDSEGQIIDYGDYEELRNMTSDDEIEFSRETVKINTDESSLYYEGRIKGNATPWKFEIKYFLDDEEIKPEDLAGESGKLKITLSINPNDEKYLEFFEKFALQISLSLDTKLARNIVAEGATLANVGRNKQLSYIVLPGMGGEYEITADVENFEMDGFAINGIKMNFASALEQFLDNTMLTSSIAQLENGVKRLDSGAKAILEAVNALSLGSKALLDGMDVLTTGAEALADGADELFGGIDQLAGGAKSLYNGAMQLASNSPQLNMLSDLIYDSSVEQSRLLLQTLGYHVDENTSLETLKSYLEKRQAELMGTASYVYPLLRDAFVKRLQEVREKLVSCIEGTSDCQYYTLAHDYINLALMSLDLENAGGDPSCIDYILSGFSDFIDSLGGLEAAKEIYNYFIVEGLNPALKAIADSELAIVHGYIESLMTSILTSDPVYKALAILVYCKGVKSFTAGVDSLFNGAYSLYSGVNVLEEGAKTLTDGAKELFAGLGTAGSGVEELYAGVVALREGCIELKDGTDQLMVSVTSSSKVVIAKVIETIENIFGAEYAPRSYVDERNDETVEMVQFVFNFDGIKLPEVVVPDATEVKLTFFQKLMKLFVKEI